MPKNTDSSDSDPEESSDISSSESDEPINNGQQNQLGVPEYEKQRQARIAQNMARMEALGLSQMASSLMGSAHNVKKTTAKNQKKGKAKKIDDDYRPEEDERCSSDSEDKGYDDEYLVAKSSGSSRKKVKSNGPKPKKTPSKGSVSYPNSRDEEEEAFLQAIALSLKDRAVTGVAHKLPQGSDVVNSNLNERKEETQVQEDTGRRKRKKSFASRLQMTEDEFVLHYSQFDENWNGGISASDLQRVATSHDFMWTDQESADMIHLFDSDGDAKLSLEDFRKIVVRCNMIKEPENS